MLRAAGAVALSLLLACAGAGKRSSSCLPVPAEVTIAAGIVVFADCAVDSRPTAPPTAFRHNFIPPRGATCMSGTISFVVNINGDAIMQTAREGYTTHEALPKAMIAALPTIKWKPGKVQGRPVAVYTSWTAKGQSFFVARAGSGPPPPSPKC